MFSFLQYGPFDSNDYRSTMMMIIIAKLGGDYHPNVDYNHSKKMSNARKNIAIRQIIIYQAKIKEHVPEEHV